MNFPAQFTIISDEVSQDLPVLIRFVKEFNLPGIELRSMFGRAFKDLTPADLAEVKRVARGEGWKIFGCSTPVFKCEIDDAAAVQAHLEEFKRSLGVAQELDCDLLRVFTFLRRSPAENAALLPRVVEHLLKLDALAAGTQVRLGVENEHSCIIGTGLEAALYLPHLPAPRFGIVWDPCNVLYVPGAPPTPPPAMPPSPRACITSTSRTPAASRRSPAPSRPSPPRSASATSAGRPTSPRSSAAATQAFSPSRPTGA
jgi:sugar phosphate isomerase/epimerase